jgi:hypothetical protein
LDGDGSSLGTYGHGSDVTANGCVPCEQTVGGSDLPSGGIDCSSRRGDKIGVAAYGLVRAKYRIYEDDGAAVVKQAAALTGATSCDGQVSKREVDVGLNEKHAYGSSSIQRHVPSRAIQQDIRRDH